MCLTGHYIANDWEHETFLPMSYCIKWCGINQALWISRICMYTALYCYLVNWKKWKWHYFLIAGTILYWTAMIPWLWRLKYLTWP